MRSLLILLSLGLLGACSSIEWVEREEKPVTIREYKFNWNNSDLDKILVEEMIEHDFDKIIPSDSVAFNFKADLLESWGNIFVAMAFKESSWKADAKYTERFKDRNGEFIVSTGLFQLSQESGLGYKCDFKTLSKLTDPRTNIDCAMKIMKRWVINDGYITKNVGGSKPWRGGARYWSVLRKEDTLKYIKDANK